MLSGTWLLLLILVLVFAWRKRWLYYYSLQYPGPFTVPVVMTSFKLITSFYKDIDKTFFQLCASHPLIFKLWIMNDLIIVNSRPEDVEVLLNTFLEKNFYYKLWEDLLGSNILTSPVSIWRPRRKEGIRWFKQNIINSFYGVFVKYAEELVEDLDTSSGQERSDDLLHEIWKRGIDAAIKNLYGVDPESIEDRHKIIKWIIRGEKIIAERFIKFWLQNEFIFRLSGLRKESTSIFNKGHTFAKNALVKKKQEIEANCVDDIVLESFADYALNVMAKTVSETDMINEGVTLTIAASETSSLTINFAILILGLHPEVQNHIYEEIGSLSVDNVSRMDYTERVIKETMRIFPIAPIMLRYIDKDFKLGSFVYPAGSNLMVPIGYIHRRPDLWQDPLKFDPDRFSPEEVAKRHRSAYIPFSIGARNCLGQQYAMLSMKMTLAHIVKHFKIKAVNYSSIEDIRTEWHILNKPKGNRVIFERRE